MSFRPPPSLRFTPSVRAPAPAPAQRWTCHSCLARTAPQTPPQRRRLPPQVSSFHSSTPSLSDSPANHYDALQLPHSASMGDIKRQFYTLSKKHHPDRNPNDPAASTRFVAISEAYHTLSVPEKRAQYDAQITQAKASRWGRSAGAHPQGSHSSASFAGSRPASGLNKKRSTFRGPPPSFYKNGGYGTHSAKRAEYAHHRHAGEKRGEKEAGAESYGGFAGFGPGQTQQGQEVPHFDNKRHKETHDSVYEHIQSRRRRTRASQISEEIGRGGLVNFALVGGAVVLMGLSVKIFGDNHDERKKVKAKDAS
ncbi:DnaJ-domain-containing protein [Lentithecium fluviatile CBS 122367]|uniref:DnaJ-domain-containing protein n=1 Tax=Lentithecium fluviatile CBS 122367 TaxID=1168545 RepID=A0A6G1IGC2_9PLEO|nr:DnaJ-domain-containing protein [Lentithecium fluviatile CBS 122367]